MMSRSMLPLILLAVTALVGAVGYTFVRAPLSASSTLQATPAPPAIIALAGDPGNGQTAADEPVTAAGTSAVFEIQPGKAQARFVIDEVLRGAPNTVVGTTDQVAGQIAVDLAQPGSARVGAVQINAQTLATDDNLRNNAIRRFILGTDQYQYITFTPMTVSGLPSSAAMGQPYPVQITGQLTIRDVTREATFDATVTPTADNLLIGTARTTIRYADWSISIPQVPFVASVSDQVRLELDFTATAV